MARPSWSWILACAVAACSRAGPPPPGTVSIALGDERTLAALYAYPNRCAPETLAQTIERYLGDSLRRDGFPGARSRVTPGDGGYQAHLEGDAPGLRDYAQRLPAFLANGKVALAVTDRLRTTPVWRPGWRMFLPLGLSLVRPRSVQLLHFPPDSSLSSEDYLDSATTRRWERLLELNGVRAEDVARDEAIVDLAPVAAPADAGSTLPTTEYSEYTKAQLRLLLQRPGAGTTAPLVAYGLPVREWVAATYKPVVRRGSDARAAESGSDLRVLDTAYVAVVEGARTPLLVANHPSYIWNVTQPERRYATMLEDLAAACWQAEMPRTPERAPEDVLAGCKTAWSARSQDVCAQVEIELCRLAPDAARRACAAHPETPPPCPDREAPEGWASALDDAGLAEELERFPAEVRRFLEPLRQGGVLSAERSRAVGEALRLGPDALMMRLLPLAQRFAVPAISRFHVGAVARGPVDAAGWGTLYLGGNVEFRGQALGLVVHAEQAAVSHAWLRGEHEVSAVAVSAPPCGHCRQFLYEVPSGSALPVVLARCERPVPPATGAPVAAVPLGALLPHAFGPRELGRGGRLLAPPDPPPHVELVDAEGDPLTTLALDAARQSYAPYTGGLAGAALELDDGARFAGRYAENAAYNPSVGPVESAAVLARVSRPLGAPLRVRRAVLVEVPGAASVRLRSEAALAALAPRVKLEYARARVADAQHARRGGP